MYRFPITDYIAIGLNLEQLWCCQVRTERTQRRGCDVQATSSVSILEHLMLFIFTRWPPMDLLFTGRLAYQSNVRFIENPKQ